MNRVTSFSPLDQFPSATANAIQDQAAPVLPFVGYRRGGDIYTKVAGAKIIYVSPVTLCMGDTVGDEVGVNTAEASLDTTGLTSFNNWNYIYTQVSSGVISFTVGGVAYPPEASLVFQGGNTDLRYLGCIYCDGSGNILPFTKVGTRYWWRRSQIADTTFHFFTTAVAAGWAAQSMVAMVPPHVQLVTVELRCTQTAATHNTSIGVRTTGDSAYESGRVYTAYSGGALEYGVGVVSLECDASQSIDVDVVDTPGGGTVTGDAYVVGFEERSV